MRDSVDVDRTQGPTHPAMVEALRSYLTGLAGCNTAMLEQLGTAADWTALAAAELSRRRARFLEVFDDALLGAIAEHRVRVQDVALQLVAQRRGAAGVPDLVAIMRTSTQAIAADVLAVPELEVHSRGDSATCRLHVGALREALAQAFAAGVGAARRD